MTVPDDAARIDPVEIQEIPASLKFFVGSLAGGLVALGLGLLLELFIYRRFAASLRDFPFVINGWLFVAVGGLFTWIGLKGLIARPIFLRLDSGALICPNQGLEIPWDRIRGVRGFVTGGGGGRYLAIRVANREEIAGANSTRLKYWAIGSELAEEEIPVALTGAGLGLDPIVAAIEARLARLTSEPT
jgi:hypothetical protein